jgi:hypothetical protein
MSDPAEFDTVSFPGGYDQAEQIAAVELAAMQHVRPVPAGPVARAITEALLRGLQERHPRDRDLCTQPYHVRSGELAGERLSLLCSHLALSWFGLAYWAYGLVAVRSGVSIAEHEGEQMFVAPIRMALGELGVRVSDAECIAEVDRFLPFEPSPRGVEASALVFLSYVRFLHRAALRRRRVVAPGLSLPDVALVHDAQDAEAAGNVSRFLASHGVTLRERPEAVTQATRLLVLLSDAAIGTAGFWQALERWKDCPVIPMVLCLMPKAALYGAPPPQAPPALWSWLGENVAVTLGSETDRYGVLLRALDAPDPRQWWWRESDTLEIGIAVDVLDQKLPRRRHPAPAPPRSWSPIPMPSTARCCRPACSRASVPRGPTPTAPRGTTSTDATSSCGSGSGRAGSRMPWRGSWCSIARGSRAPAPPWTASVPAGSSRRRCSRSASARSRTRPARSWSSSRERRGARPRPRSPGSTSAPSTSPRSCITCPRRPSPADSACACSRRPGRAS